MSRRHLYYFIPWFIIVYFTISFVPIATRQNSEIFPFFSFKLYSRIPNTFEHYDLIINYDLPSARSVIYNNPSWSNIERQYYGKVINEIGHAYAEHGTVDCERLRVLFPQTAAIALVKVNGDYLNAVRKNQYEVTVIKIIR